MGYWPVVRNEACCEHDSELLEARACISEFGTWHLACFSANTCAGSRLVRPLLEHILYFCETFLCRRSRSYSSGHRSSAVHSVYVSIRHFVQCSSQTCLQFSGSDVRGRPTADRQLDPVGSREGRAEAARGAGGRKSGAGDGRSP